MYSNMRKYAVVLRLLYFECSLGLSWQGKSLFNVNTVIRAYYTNQFFGCSWGVMEESLGKNTKNHGQFFKCQTEMLGCFDLRRVITQVP